MTVWFEFRLSFELGLLFVFFALLFLCCLLFAVLALVSSVLRQEIDWEERLQYDLFCVEWDAIP